MEWKLYEGGVPFFSMPEFFDGHPHIDPSLQVGHAERVALVADQVAREVGRRPADERLVTDLGCGDGSLLRALGQRGIQGWGYDLGVANVIVATNHGSKVTQANVVEDLAHLDLAHIVCATEMLEHLADPHRFLRRLSRRAREGFFSVPALETADRHYEHHAWAWDVPGFTAMLEANGWQPLSVGTVRVDSEWGPMGWQAVYAWTKELG